MAATGWLALVDKLAWPATTLTGGLVVFFSLKTSISNLLSRTKTIGYGSAQLTTQQPDQVAEANTPSPIGATAAPTTTLSIGTNTLPADPTTPPTRKSPYLFELTDNPALIERTNQIEKEVKAMTFSSPEERERWLFRQGAALNFNFEFERLYRGLYSSQLAVLELAHSNAYLGGVAKDIVEGIHKEAANRYPAQYKDYDFHSWLRFLTTHNELLTESIVPDRYHITNRGLLYLNFLLHFGYRASTPL